MTLPAFLIAAYAIAILCVPSFRPPFFQQRFLVMPLAAGWHLAASAIALAVGALQHNFIVRSPTDSMNFER